MALPSSGTITMYQVAVELGIAAAGINLNDGRVRSLAGLPSGQITMLNLRGKSNFSWSVATRTVLADSGLVRSLYVDFNTSDGSVIATHSVEWFYNGGAVAAIYVGSSQPTSNTIMISSIRSSGQATRQARITVTFSNGISVSHMTGQYTFSRV